MVTVTQNTTYKHDGTDSTVACPKMLSLLNWICTLNFFDKLEHTQPTIPLFALIRHDKGLTLKTPASLSLHGGNSTFINLFDSNFSVSLPHRRGITVSLEINLSFV